MDKDKLASQVRAELLSLQQTAELAAQLLEHAGGEPAPWLAAAAAKYIADVFTGLENLWKRRCRHLGATFPQGPTAHYDTLLAFLGDPDLGGRLPPDMEARLGNYLRFRHRFVHGYGIAPRWEMVEEPLTLIPDTVSQLSEVWLEWLSQVTP